MRVCVCQTFLFFSQGDCEERESARGAEGEHGNGENGEDSGDRLGTDALGPFAAAG